MSSLKPTHDLVVKDTETGNTGKVGVAWLNEEGYYSIKLNPCIVLSYETMKGKYLTLFPANEWNKVAQRKTGKKETETLKQRMNTK